MIKRIVGIAIVAALIVTAGYFYGVPKWLGGQGGAVAQGPGQGQRAIPVAVITAAKKKVLVRIEALGTVASMASVAVRSRLDTGIVTGKFAGGAMVKLGDVLNQLETRALEAAIQAAEGNVARDQAQLEGAERDVRRYTELVAKSATPVVNLD